MTSHMAQDGFNSIERFESVGQAGRCLTLSFWRDEAADYPGIPYPVQLFMSDSRFMVAQYAGFDAVATPSGGIDISSNSFYAGKAATAVFSNGTSPGPVRASLALPLAAQFNSPSDVGLQIELKGGQYLDTSNLLFINGVWSSKCGVGCFTPVNFVTPTYHLTLTGRAGTGDTVTLVDETRTSANFDDVITTALGDHLTGLSGSLELTNNPTGYRYHLGSISLSPTSAVPEPASGSLWWLAIPGLVVAARRRR